MKFQMVFKDSFVEFEDLQAIMANGAYIVTGRSKNYADVLAENPGAAVPRQMLWDQPTFKGFIGPMYGGDGVLRYETQAAYDFYSL